MNGTKEKEKKMRHSRRLRLGALLALGVTAAVMLTTAATAGPPSREVIHDEVTFVEADFCGVSGMSVEIARVVHIKVQAVAHGPDRLEYFLSHGRTTEVLTNLANDESVNSVSSVTEKDQRVTENTDGTVTVLILATGNAVLYGADGKAIARNPGQTRFELLFAEDGSFLEFLGVVKESTGRSDDFCDAAVAALS